MFKSNLSNINRFNHNNPLLEQKKNSMIQSNLLPSKKHNSTINRMNHQRQLLHLLKARLLPRSNKFNSNNNNSSNNNSIKLSYKKKKAKDKIGINIIMILIAIRAGTVVTTDLRMIIEISNNKLMIG